jgi:hypothetical protein
LAVPLGLAEMLSEHIRARRLTIENSDALLFTSPDGGVLHYSNWLRRVWYPATVATGLGQIATDEATGRKRYVGLGFHDLRRANATGLVAEGVDTQDGAGGARPLQPTAHARSLRAGGREPGRGGGGVDWRPGSSPRQRAMDARWNPIPVAQATATRTVDGL